MGIMVETFISRIKASNLAKMFVLTFSLLRKIFDKILRSECKIRKENHFLAEKDSILYGIFFRVVSFFYVEILVKNMMLSIFHEIWGIFKKYYQQNCSISCS